MEDNVAEPKTDIVQTQSPAHEPQSTPQTTSASNEASYLQMFEDIGAHNDRIADLAREIDDQQYDQDRLRVAIQCIKELVALNNRMIELSIEMNNYFGDK